MERITAQHSRAAVRSSTLQRGAGVRRARREQSERAPVVVDALLPARADAVRERRGDERSDGEQVGAMTWVEGSGVLPLLQVLASSEVESIDVQICRILSSLCAAHTETGVCVASENQA